MQADENYQLSDESKIAFDEYIGRRMQQPHFANARLIRNALDRMRLRQAKRLPVRGPRIVTCKDLTTLEVEDVRASCVFVEPLISDAGTANWPYIGGGSFNSSRRGFDGNGSSVTATVVFGCARPYCLADTRFVCTPWLRVLNRHARCRQRGWQWPSQALMSASSMADKITPFTERARAPDPERPQRADWPAWPTYGLVDDLLPVMRAWRAEGRRIALATLVHVNGSSPRPVGSEMAINDRGEVAGYVSGGCVEAAVAAQALDVLETGTPVTLDYGAGSPVLDVQLTCGGRIGIFVRALDDADDYVARWNDARTRRQALDVRIDLSDGSQGYGPVSSDSGRPVFHQRYLPRPRLVIAGGDPVTLALAQLAPTFGYDVVLLRPYGPAAPPPGTTLAYYDTRPLARALDSLELDALSAVYTLTHDIDDDHAMLAKALASPAFSVGALGSRTKAAERERRLRDAGFDDHDLRRLHTPAGLSINAREPREIALSVLAELVALRPCERAAQA